jgi:hypothetical protein
MSRDSLMLGRLDLTHASPPKEIRSLDDRRGVEESSGAAPRRLLQAISYLPAASLSEAFASMSERPKRGSRMRSLRTKKLADSQIYEPEIYMITVLCIDRRLEK